MANLRVPDSQRDLLVGLMELDTQEAEQLASEIDRSDGKFQSVADLLSKRQVDGAGAFGAVMSLMGAARRYRILPKTLVEGLRESFGVEHEGASLVALLETDTVQRFSKALTLRNEYERIVTDTRILTDLRPVFNDENEGEPDEVHVEAAVVNHTLRFFYTSGDGDHEVHFALDAADLTKLRAQIDRALKKDAATQALAESANVLVLQPMEELGEH